MQTSSYVSFNNDNDGKAQKPSAREGWGPCPGSEEEGQVSSEGSPGTSVPLWKGPSSDPEGGAASQTLGKAAGACLLSAGHGALSLNPRPRAQLGGEAQTETGFSLRPHHSGRSHRQEVKLVPGCQEKRGPTSDTCLLGAGRRVVWGPLWALGAGDTSTAGGGRGSLRWPAPAVNRRSPSVRVLGGLQGAQGTLSPGFSWVL